MRKLIVSIAATLGLVFVLGCSGLTDMLGVEMDVQQGEDAVHPADFPLPPPQGAEIRESAVVTMSGLSTSTVTYVLPADADVNAVLDTYEAVMKDRGFTPERNGTRVAVENHEETTLVAEITETSGSKVLTLVAASISFGQGE